MTATRVATRALAWIPVAVAGVASVRLARAFLLDDFSWRIVAEQSRADSAWYYRLAGTWATAEGSLLVFATIVGVIGLASTWHHPRAGALVGLTVAALVAIDLAVASPFARLAIPGTAGMGLTPILEHPAMAIHPPLLYAGLGMSLGPWALAAVGELDRARLQRTMLGSFAVVTVAVTLGAWWSYAEQGWGGYWAWDPVENASLAVWLALLVAVHALRRADRRAGAMLSMAPWCVALLGSAASRSGAVPSVHAFAEAGRVGTLLALLGLASLFPTVVSRSSGSSARRRSPDVWTAFPIVLGGAVLVILAIGTTVPFVARAGGETVRITGRFYAPLVTPVALGAVVVLFIMVGRAGARRRVAASAWLSHAGFAVLVVAALASTADRHASAKLDQGETVEIVGVSVTNRGVEMTAGPRRGSRAVTADLLVDGRRTRPVLVAYPAHGGVLAETALITPAVVDTQIALLRADDEGAVLIEVRRKPGVVGVWGGAAMIALGAATARRARTPSVPGTGSGRREPGVGSRSRQSETTAT